MLGSPSKRVKKRLCLTDIISKDLIPLIIKDLPPISLMSLKRAFPEDIKLSQIIGSIHEIVTERFRLYFKDARLFETLWFNVIKNHHAYLTGSILLRILTGDENWLINDIDIAFNNNELNTKFSNIPYIDRIESYGDYDEKVDDIFKVYKVVHPSFIVNNNNLKTQFIFTKGITQYINSFDLDFCKSTLSFDKLIVYKPESILKKTAIIDPFDTFYIPNLMDETIMNFDNRIEQYSLKLYERIIKYQQRGYSVKCKEYSIPRSHNYMFNRVELPFQIVNWYFLYSSKGQCYYKLQQYYKNIFKHNYYEELKREIGIENASAVYSRAVSILYDFWIKRYDQLENKFKIV